MNINEVVECAWLMRKSAEHLHFVAKRLEETGLIDHYRAAQMSAECTNACHAFVLAGSKAIGVEEFEERLNALDKPQVAFEIY